MATDEEIMMARMRSFLPRRIAAPVNPVLDPTEAEATGQPSLDTSVQNAFGMNPDVERLNLLPRYSAKDGLVAPSIVYDAARAITAPGHQLRHGNLGPSEAMETALGTMGGGMGVSSAVGAPVGALGMFIGPKAKTWNAATHDIALGMEKAGATDKDIWQATGNWRGPDKNWRQEISDHNADFTGKYTPRYRYAPVQDMYNNPELTAAYPNIVKNTHMQVGVSEYPSGGFSPQRNNIRTTEDPTMFSKIITRFGAQPKGQAFEHAIRVSGPTKQDTLGVAAHELQHNIQVNEGWQGGSNPDMWLDRAKAVLNEEAQRNKATTVIPHPSTLNKKANDLAYDWYRRTFGEAEARATEARKNMNYAERRAKFPEESYDVPIHTLLPPLY